ncbi:MAG TPA: UDP-4-amino-4,6-dideoxy-N-acetyl-beta-L-altrosamine N-acetyltransferase [Gammaproteobacteria bacterium]|jgi:UDP-4-amino-4,6-dideoxy-N-acetyl-beta-L-altrosamine N-acetyltransferase|nr:UDP-4-amino-4,6-dideoxy-N-acetyl-beta-L-altrosamine N-acetyltransferase [Gammaproteobacteria bacterium]
MSDRSPRAIDLVPLTTLDQDTQLRILEIRNAESVREWMLSDHIISAEEHLAWIDRLPNDASQIIFAVMGEGGEPLGGMGVTGIDRQHKRAEWTYYLAEAARVGVGAALEYALIQFVFDTLKLDKLNCEVIEGNEAVVKMHRKFLFQDEGFRRDNILKGGRRLGVYYLGLTCDEWQTQRHLVDAKYKGVFGKFAVAVHWPAGSSPGQD